jgi:hypothetical protein
VRLFARGGAFARHGRQDVLARRLVLSRQQALVGVENRGVFHRGGAYLSAWRNAFLGGDYRLRLSRRVTFSCLAKKK